VAGLFDPLRVGPLELRNRIVMPPMATQLSTTKGEVTEGLIEHYARRAGGLGLLIVEHAYVTVGGKLSERQLGIHDDALIPGLKKLVAKIHSLGTSIALQINHGGRWTDKEITGVEPVAPSPVTFEDGTSARGLSPDEIENLVEAFVEAAGWAVEAGFDAVEVHGAHGFLLNQFLSPLTNGRRDGYGGSLENRMRFPLNVVQGVKGRIGEAPLLYRLGADDMKPGGFEIKEAKKFAQRLVEAGVNILDISGGLCGGSPAQLQGRQGYFMPLAEAMKDVVDVPVIGVGGITEPEFADRIVRENRVDLVAIGRALLKDPDWAIKAKRCLS